MIFSCVLHKKRTMKKFNPKQIIAAILMSLFLLGGCKDTEGSKPGPSTNNPADKNPASTKENQMLDSEK